MLFLALNMLSCKDATQKADTKKNTIEFDFSTVKKYRDSKRNGHSMNDYDSIFTPSQRTEISNILYEYSIKTTRQIVVVTIYSIKPYSDIQKYATDISNYWGVGSAERNNGLTIVVCSTCKQIRIATGTATELILTNEICKEVIDSKIIPEFRDGNFYHGIKNGITELIKKWE